MNEPIQMSSADLDESDVQAVADVVRSGRLALGPRAEEFEKNVADYVGVRQAVSISSGTAALHVALEALGVGPGDEVLVPSFTFVASVNSILYRKAVPVFLDIERDTFNLSPEEMEKKITSRTRALMAVDVFGHPVDWDAILPLAKRHGLKVVDDACEALGAEYKGRKAGAFGDAATFAFYPNKQITTGEGGMLVTNDAQVAQLARSLRNQGRGSMGAWLEHERLGYNYRLDEMSAALGVSQMRRVEEFVRKREAVAQMYDERLKKFDWARTPVVRTGVRMSRLVYVVLLREGLDRDPIMRDMESQGVPARGYFSPIHLQPYIMDSCGVGPGSLPITENIARRTIALPFHNNISADQVERVVRALESAVEKTSGALELR